MLLLNVGGVVDIECVRELPGAVVLMSQGGSGCGDAVAKVIIGEVNPSGRLTATWAKAVCRLSLCRRLLCGAG